MSGVFKNEPSFISEPSKDFEEIKKAREDVNLMAQKIIEQVWEKE
jgi:hypothetical protein